MTDCLPSNTPLEETGFGYTLSLINGKYKMIIMYWLYGKTVMRFNELQRCIGNISFRTLSNTLKELERDELIIRKEYPQIPRRLSTVFRKRTVFNSVVRYDVPMGRAEYEFLVL